MSKELEGAPFVTKTYQLVTDPQTNHLVSWSDTQDSFIVWKPVDFASDVLPQFFKHNNFCSFIRQLNTYGFHKVDGKQWEFKHELFRKDSPQRLKEIARRKSKKRNTGEKDEDETPQAPSPAVQHQPVQQPNNNVVPQFVPVKVEVESPPSKESKKSDDTDPGEVEKLRELNNLLMLEVNRLQQQQESTQDVVNAILEQLMESKLEQHKLHKKVAQLSREVYSQLPANNISLITPPQSPLRLDINDSKKLLQPPFFTAEQVLTGANRAPVDPNSLGAYLDETSLLGLDNLAHLELTPNVEQELAKMLQQSFTPPQSPAHQTQY